MTGKNTGTLLFLRYPKWWVKLPTIGHFHPRIFRIEKDTTVCFLGDRLQNGSPCAIGPLSTCPVCDVGVLRPNGWTNQDETWQAGRPRPRPRKGAQQPLPHSKLTGAGFACVRIIHGPCLLWPSGWMDQGETWQGGRPRPRPHCVTWGPSSPPNERGTTAPPTFRSMSIVAKLLDGSRHHLIRK